MKLKFSFWAVLGAVLLCSANVFALTCKNDYSSASGCASNANAAGDCTTLGYATADVSGCSHYIYCPFDTAYKRCTNAVETACATGTYQTKEECVNAAGNGFRQLCTKTSNGCWAPKNPTVSCSGYTLSKCPANGVCSTCPSDKSKFKLTGCNTNYYLDTDKCVSCASAKSSLESEAKLAANSWLTCCTAPNSGPTHGPVQAVGYICGDAILSKKCRSSCTDYTSIGSWSDGCFRLGNLAPLNPTIPEMKNACLNVLTDVANRVKNFNNVCPNYKITASINPSRQCDYINCGGETTLVSGSGTYKGCKYGL